MVELNLESIGVTYRPWNYPLAEQALHTLKEALAKGKPRLTSHLLWLTRQRPPRPLRTAEAAHEASSTARGSAAAAQPAHVSATGGITP